MTYQHTSIRVPALVFSVSCLLVCAGSAPAFAQATDSLVLRGGGLVADFGSGLRLDLTNSQTGTTLNLENDLGFQRTTGTWFVDGGYRISDRHRLYFSYVGVSRDTTKSAISEPITVRDQTFQVGATVQAYMDTKYTSIDYGFALVKNATTDIVATIGLTVVHVNTGIGLTAAATTGSSVSRDLSSNASSNTAYPVPGVQVAIKVHPRATITGYTRYIRATLEGVTQASTDGRIGVEFRLVPRVGIGASYYFNHVMEEATGEKFAGKFHYTFQGPQIYALFGF